MLLCESARVRIHRYGQHAACGVTTNTGFTLECKKYGCSIKEGMTAPTETVPALVWKQIFRMWPGERHRVSGSDTSGIGDGNSCFFLSIMQCVIHRNLKKCAHWTLYQKSNDSRGGSLTTATVYQLRPAVVLVKSAAKWRDWDWHELKLSILTRKGNWVLENWQDASNLSQQYHQPRLNTRSARSALIFVRQWQHVLF